MPYGTGYSDYSRRLNSCLHAVHALHLLLLVCIPCGIEHGDNSLDLPLVTVHREHVAIVAARSSGCFGRTAGDRRRDCHAFLSAQHRGELLFHRWCCSNGNLVSFPGDIHSCLLAASFLHPPLERQAPHFGTSVWHPWIGCSSASYWNRERRRSKNCQYSEKLY